MTKKKTTVKKIKKERVIESNPWKEIKILKDKKSFLEIQHVLRRLYDWVSTNPVSKSLAFQKRLIACKPSEVRIFIKLEKGFEFKVQCEILKNKKVESKGEWHHVDGIQEERNRLIAINPSHPIFEIVCMTDLYGRAKIVKWKR